MVAAGPAIMSHSREKEGSGVKGYICLFIAEKPKLSQKPPHEVTYFLYDSLVRTGSFLAEREAEKVGSRIVINDLGTSGSIA